jgi:SHS2 domain-containing protein
LPRRSYNALAACGGEASISKGFRILEHTADAGLEAYGKDLPELFANAARGLFQIITELPSIRESVEREVRAEAPDPEALLVAWLNEFVFLFDTERLLFRRFDVRECTGTTIRARACGEPVDLARHDIKTGVKAATYHGLAIRRTKRGYTARIIVDI